CTRRALYTCEAGRHQPDRPRPPHQVRGERRYRLLTSADCSQGSGRKGTGTVASTRNDAGGPLCESKAPKLVRPFHKKGRTRAKSERRIVAFSVFRGALQTSTGRLGLVRHVGEWRRQASVIDHRA